MPPGCVPRWNKQILCKQGTCAANMNAGAANMNPATLGCTRAALIWKNAVQMGRVCRRNEPCGAGMYELAADESREAPERTHDKTSIARTSAVSVSLLSSHSLQAQAPPAALATKACAPAAGLTFICGLQNPEDVVPVPGTRWLLTSGMAPGAGLTVVDTQAKTVRKLYAPGTANARADRTRFANCPGPLDREAGRAARPRPPAGRGRTLHGVRHQPRRARVGRSVRAEPRVGGAAGSHPQPGSGACCCRRSLPPTASRRSPMARSWRRCSFCPARRSRTRLRCGTPASCSSGRRGRPAFVELKGTELVANNGIETSPDDREFYVASTTTRRVYAFSRAKPGAGPLRFAQLKDFGPDNVRWTADNRLITAGLIDNEPACGGRPKDEKGIRCPMGYAVATIDPKTMTATEIARGPRTPSFTGTAMAAVVGNELWLGSFLADRLAYRSAEVNAAAVPRLRGPHHSSRRGPGPAACRRTRPVPGTGPGTRSRPTPAHVTGRRDRASRGCGADRQRQSDSGRRHVPNIRHRAAASGHSPIHLQRHLEAKHLHDDHPQQDRRVPRGTRRCSVDLSVEDPADRVRVIYVPTPPTWRRRWSISPASALATTSSTSPAAEMPGSPIAAIRAGARRGICVDIDPERAQESKANVEKAGFADRIDVREGDALDVKDLSDVSVVLLYMGDHFNMLIRPVLWRELKVGSRIVSHRFTMGDWEPDKTISVTSEFRRRLRAASLDDYRGDQATPSPGAVVVVALVRAPPMAALHGEVSVRRSLISLLLCLTVVPSAVRGAGQPVSMTMETIEEAIALGRQTAPRPYALHRWIGGDPDVHSASIYTPFIRVALASRVATLEGRARSPSNIDRALVEPVLYVAVRAYSQTGFGSGRVMTGTIHLAGPGLRETIAPLWTRPPGSGTAVDGTRSGNQECQLRRRFSFGRSQARPRIRRTDRTIVVDAPPIPRADYAE